MAPPTHSRSARCRSLGASSQKFAEKTKFKDITGRIPDILENTQNFLNLYLREEHIIKGFEPEIKREISPAALKEGVVNAIAHKDYTVAAPIRIILYEDRLEIRTPGKLPNSVTIDSMKIGGSLILRQAKICFKWLCHGHFFVI